jgi:cyclohexadienyl dehydratase
MTTVKANRFILIASLLLAAALTGCSPSPEPGGRIENRESQSALDAILERGSIRVGTTGDYFLSFVDTETGERAGFEIDLVHQLAKDLDLEVEWIQTDWANLVNGIAAGKYDITGAASYNMGRARTAGYTDPVLDYGTIALTTQELVEQFSTWDDVNSPEVTVAVRQGTAFEDLSRVISPDAEVRSIASPATEFQELLSGKAQVALTSSIDAANLVNQYPELRIADLPARVRTPIGMLTPRGDHALINFLNTWIASKEYSGYLEELRTKWNL